MDLAAVCSKAIVLLLFIVDPIVLGGSVFSPLFVFIPLCPSSFSFILMGKRELVALLYNSFLDVL